MPSDWEDEEDTAVRGVAADLLRKALLEEIDLIAEAVKRRDPRRE